MILNYLLKISTFHLFFQVKAMHIFKYNQLKKELEEKTEQIAKLQDNKEDDDFHPKHKAAFDKKEKEKESAVKIVKNLSRIRRQSTHDERRLSLWERFQEVGTMTDPVSEMCGCIEKSARIDELNRQLKLQECQVTYLNFLKKNNPLQCDLDEEKMVSLTSGDFYHFSNYQFNSRPLLRLAGSVKR
jgi:hypothetical protein